MSEPTWIRYHDDPPCQADLDREGRCPDCGFIPDMQSVGLREQQEPIYGPSPLAAACHWLAVGEELRQASVLAFVRNAMPGRREAPEPEPDRPINCEGT